MKQALFLIAIYSLIIHQANKNAKVIKTKKPNQVVQKSTLMANTVRSPFLFQNYQTIISVNNRKNLSNPVALMQ